MRPSFVDDNETPPQFVTGKIQPWLLSSRLAPDVDESFDAGQGSGESYLVPNLDWMPVSVRSAKIRQRRQMLGSDPVDGLDLSWKLP